MFRSWGAIVSPIFAEIEGGRGQNGTFLGDFTWNDPFTFERRNTLHFPVQFRQPILRRLCHIRAAEGFSMFSQWWCESPVRRVPLVRKSEKGCIWCGKWRIWCGKGHPCCGKGASGVEKGASRLKEHPLMRLHSSILTNAYHLHKLHRNAILW